MRSGFTEEYTDSIVSAAQVNSDVIEGPFSPCGPGPLLALDGPEHDICYATEILEREPSQTCLSH